MGLNLPGERATEKGESIETSTDLSMTHLYDHRFRCLYIYVYVSGFLSREGSTKEEDRKLTQESIRPARKFCPQVGGGTRD